MNFRQPRIEAPKLRRSVRGMPCLLNVAGVCEDAYPHETVVPCHPPGEGKGVGTKTDDFCVVAGCADCHAELDGRTDKTKMPPEAKEFYWRRGMQRQWRVWWQTGVVKA